MRTIIGTTPFIDNISVLHHLLLLTRRQILNMTVIKKILFENSLSYICYYYVYILTGYPVQNRIGELKMKRRIVSLVIVMLICISLAGNTLALSNDDVVVQPMSSITVSCGLTKTGSQYRAWSRTDTSFSTSLTARVSLYQVVNGNEVYIATANASATGTTVTASTTRSLSSGTYKIYGYGTGNSSSSSDSCTVTVP